MSRRPIQWTDRAKFIGAVLFSLTAFAVLSVFTNMVR